jgi:glucose-1-phosphate adenylyltransferase
MKDVITLVLGGGRGTRLYPLTKHRAKPAVPLGGKYRLIDIPLSNCINSGLNQVYVLTQFLSVSLHRHIRNTYRFDIFDKGFVEILAAQQTPFHKSDWYQGTADAVRKNLRYLEYNGNRYALILSGDQLYRMDYRQLLATHQQSGAEVTLGAVPVSSSAASAFGIVRFDQTGRVTGFVEKPKTEQDLARARTDPSWMERFGVQANGRDCLANMGIYVFNFDTLKEILTTTDDQDFGKEIFPKSIDQRHVQVHLFDDYWEDIGTIRSFFDANLRLAAEHPPFQFGSAKAPIYTRPRFLPTTRLANAAVKDSLIADGCEIGDGAVIENSVIGLRCRVGQNVTIRNSVIMGADYYEETVPAGKPGIGIGDNSVIEGAIIDKLVRIGQDVRVANDANVEENEDSPPCVIRDGIPIILKESTLPDGWSL